MSTAWGSSCQPVSFLEAPPAPGSTRGSGWNPEGRWLDCARVIGGSSTSHPEYPPLHEGACEGADADHDAQCVQQPSCEETSRLRSTWYMMQSDPGALEHFVLSRAAFSSCLTMGTSRRAAIRLAVLGMVALRRIWSPRAYSRSGCSYLASCRSQRPGVIDNAAGTATSGAWQVLTLYQSLNSPKSTREPGTRTNWILTVLPFVVADSTGTVNSTAGSRSASAGSPPTLCRKPVLLPRYVRSPGCHCAR